MSFFRKSHRDELPPIDTILTQNNLEEVRATIDHLDIPREQFIVVGSAALTLLGLERRAHDLDIVVHEDILADPTHLPSGISVKPAASSRPQQPHLNVDTKPLPSELLSHRDVLDIIYGNDQGFDSYVEHNPPLTTPDGIQIVQPSALLHRKRNPLRIGDDRLQKLSQDRYDATLLEHHLQHFL